MIVIRWPRGVKCSNDDIVTLGPSCVSSDSTRSAPPRVSEGITPRIFKLHLASQSGEIDSYVGRSRALTACPLGHGLECAGYFTPQMGVNLVHVV